MDSLRDKLKKATVIHAARLHRYDKESMGPNWRASTALLELVDQPGQEPLPQLPEDCEELGAGFVARLRGLASGI
jgi:hypothetical protein